jgi:hypothetical protein
MINIAYQYQYDSTIQTALMGWIYDLHAGDKELTKSFQEKPFWEMCTYKTKLKMEIQHQDWPYKSGCEGGKQMEVVQHHDQ